MNVSLDEYIYFECVCTDYTSVQPHKCPCKNVETALGGEEEEEEDGETPVLTTEDKEGKQGAASPPSTRLDD